MLCLMTHDLGVWLLGVIAERNDSENDAGATLPLPKAEVVVAEPSLGDTPGVRVIVHDHRTGHDLRTLRDGSRGYETAPLMLEDANGVHIKLTPIGTPGHAAVSHIAIGGTGL